MGQLYSNKPTSALMLQWAARKACNRRALVTYTCKQCDYTWTPRPKRFEQGRDKPMKCPNCQSREWDKPKEGSTPASDG